MKANYFFRCVFFSAAILFFACGTTALAVGISTTDKYAWSENSGWLSFRPTHGGASVYYDHLEGYAWSESIGFIRLGSYTGGGSHYYANTGSADWGVNKDASGNLFGYAWSENAGWISFNSSHSQVTIAIAGNGSFDGYAWSESVGWIHFKGTSPAYNVLRINDAPVIAQGDSVSVTMDEDSSPTPWSIPTISASDAESEPLAWTKTGDPSNGTASVSGSGAATYSPNGNWNGTDSFVAQVYDTSGGTDSITVYVTVNPVNDAPVITGQNSVSTSEDTALSIGHHHITVTDIDNSYPSGFGLTAQDGANYTRSGLAVTPNANFNGTLSVPVKINDGLADSNVYNLSVTVTPVDDGPLVSVALSDVTVSEDAGSMPVSLASLFTDIDNDNSGIVKSVISNSNPGLVSATVSGDTLTLACQPDQNGTASVTIRGTSNGKTADDTFTVTVNATDDALYTANPIADVTADEDAADTGINLG
ncbi:MAG: tandem-95 repeat protein, partial [Desulfobacterales bacterium]|nr:tandem-95 repeat protein [Desulfobacterales bacterium]